MPNKKLLAFSYYGGKFSHLNWLLPLLPTDCKVFVDVFGGSGAVLMNRDPSPIEVFNDLDGEVVNFFKVLRDNTDEMWEQIFFTPYSRNEFANACHFSDVGSPVERARRFYTLLRQGRGGAPQPRTPGRWSYCTDLVRKGMPARISALYSKLPDLMLVADRFRRVQIENDSFAKIIARYGGAETFFYCDPPYVHESRKSVKNYTHEMTSLDHAELHTALAGSKSRWAVSGYRCELMDDMYASAHRHDGPVKRALGAMTDRQESLWTNYEMR